MRLGARIVKTGVAVVLAYYVSDWFHLNPPLFVVIAAILTTQPTIYLSLKYFLDQLQANAVGALVSVIAAFAIGNEPIVIGLVVIVVIVINLFLRLESSIGLSILTVVAVMAEPTGALNRFLLIMTGIVLSILVNVVFLPPNPERQLVEKLRNLHEQIIGLLRNATEGLWKEASLTKEKRQLLQEVKKAEQLYEVYKKERSIRKSHRKHKAYKLVVYKNMLEILSFELQLIRSIRRHIGEPEMIRIQDAILEVAHEHELIFLKYEGKVRIKPKGNASKRFEPQMLGLFQQEVKASNGHEQTNGRHWIVLSGQLIDLEERLDLLDRIVNGYVRRHVKPGSST